MRKLLFISMMAVSFCQFINAQHGNFMVDYNRMFPSSSKPSMEGLKALPASFNNNINLGYSYHFNEDSPFIFKISAGLYTGSNENNFAKQFATDNKFEYDFTSTSKTAMGYSFTGGVQYFLPIQKLPFRLAIGADVGYMTSNGSKTDYYIGSQGQSMLLKSVETTASSMVYNPYVSGSFGLGNGISMNLKAGYNNLGGVSVGGGFNIIVANGGTAGKQKPNPHWCCMCGYIYKLCYKYPLPN